MERSTDLVTWEPAFATNVTRAADLNLRVRAEAVREFFRVKR